jgi:hypothetical protein
LWSGGTFVINTLAPGNRWNSPMNICSNTGIFPCVAAKGVKHVNVDKNVTISSKPIAPPSTPVQDESTFRYTSDSYQKILDYHVSEILLTTIIFGVILLLRFHH